jgi:hypothetical protein
MTAELERVVRPILFIDIDGVCLKHRQHSGMFDGFEPATGCLEFLEWATARFQCRWLSSRCRTGFLDGSRRAFRQAGASTADPRWAVLDRIEPAAWSVTKTEGIILLRISGGSMTIRQSTSASGFAPTIGKIG